MKKFLHKTAIASCALALAFVSGCEQRPSDDEAVRSAVRQHLSSLGTLNLQAFATDFTNISIQNNQATAEVSFRPKTGAPAGAAMQVFLSTRKTGRELAVIKKSTSGGMIQHPDSNANPHTSPSKAQFHGKLPNFQEMLGATIHSLAPSSRLRPSASALRRKTVVSQLRHL